MANKNLNELLINNEKLKIIVQKAQQIQSLEKLFKAELSLILSQNKNLSFDNDKLLNAIHIGSYNSHHLTVFVPNASVATRFRFITPELSQKLQANPLFLGLKSIHYKVRPLSSEKYEIKTTSRKKRINPETSLLLKNLLRQLKA